MTSIGIEQFRSVAATGTSRVAVGQGNRVESAPISLFGRAVAWHRADHAQSDAHAVENKRVRQAFRNALVKAYGRDVAFRVLTARFGSADLFSEDTSRLSASTIRQVMRSATSDMIGVRQQNQAATDNFVNNGGLITRFQQAAVGMHLPAALAADPGIEPAFRRAMVQHPDYGRRAFTNTEIDQIALTAIQNHFTEKQTQFEATHGGLAQLFGPPPQMANLPFKETTTVLGDLRARLQAGGTLHNEPNNFAQHALTALQHVEQTPTLLGQTHFGQPQIGQHMGQLNQQWIRLHQAEQNLAAVGGPLTPEGGALDGALRNEIQAQKTAIEGKLQFYNEYLEHDTLSEKQAAYNKLIWAQAGAVMIRDTADDLGLQLGDAELQSLMNSSAQMLNQAHQDWQQAPTDRRIDVDDPPFAQHKRDVKQNVEQAFRNAAAQATDPARRRALLRAASRVGSNMKKARVKALNETQTWQPVNRTLRVSRGGVSKSYRSEIVPASETNTRIGRDYRAMSLGGVSAGTKDDPLNAAIYRSAA